MQVRDLALIPSPTHSVWHIGGFPLRAYALCIILGIIVAVALTTKRFKDRGGDPDQIWDVAGWAIVLGIIGGRLYHLATDPELYFLGRAGTSPINALKIYDGGLGIWGAIALGGVGAWIGCRRRGIRFAVFADAAAPGVIFAQALGRFGNYFNNELYGGPTSLPWGLQIHCIDSSVGHAVVGGLATGGEACPINSATLPQLYQPTFLYEAIWDVALGFALLYLDRRLRLGRGNVLALYVMGYTAGRAWIEALRTDHANHFLGVRINDWTCLIVFLLGLGYFLSHGGFHAAREPSAYWPGRQPEGFHPAGTAEAEPDEASGDADSETADEPPGDAAGRTTAGRTTAGGDEPVDDETDTLDAELEEKDSADARSDG